MSSIFRSARRRVAVLAFSAICAVGVVGLAGADMVTNTIDNTIDADLESVSLTTGAGATTTVGFRVVNVNNLPTTDPYHDPQNGCNISGPNTYVTIQLTSSDPDVATISPSSITIEDCSNNATHNVVSAVVTAGSKNGSATFTATRTAYESSNGGAMHVNSADFTVNVSGNAATDTTAPSITHTASSCSNPSVGWSASDWCRGEVTATFSASDAGGLASPLSGTSDTFTKSTTTNGSAVNIASGAVADLAGNSNPGINAGPFKIDSVAPTSNVTGFTHGQSYVLGVDALPTPGCAGSDATSGVKSDGTPTVDSSGLTVNGVGTVSVTCNGAEDNAGNVQTAASNARTYSIVYGAGSGIGQPINPSNNSEFTQKRAVPVKFSLPGDEPDGFDTTGWTLKRQNVACANDSAFVAENPAELPAGTTSSNTGLRYDGAADQYIANATLANTSVGKCYQFVVTLDDGTTIPSPRFRVSK